MKMYYVREYTPTCRFLNNQLDTYDEMMMVSALN